MRKDLHQVIVDEPRHGSYWYAKIYKGVRRAKRLKLDTDYEVLNDDFGHHISMKAKKFRMEAKSFGDHVAPLYRCLEKQVGRPWNDVFSELCQYYDRRSMVGLHVHQHLRDRVNRNVYFDEKGRVCNIRFGQLSSWRLFVDNDGILRRVSDVNGPVDRWRNYYRELNAAREVERRKVARYFDLQGNERTKEVPVIEGDLTSGGIIFRWEKTGESHKHYDGKTEAWFKYHYIVVARTRQIAVGYEVRSGREVPVYRYEVYKTLEKVKDSASKKDIRDYGLND